MKILWLIHGYPPAHNAGAEWMAHDMNRYLSKWHEVRVLSCYDGEFEGIQVGNWADHSKLMSWFAWADVVFSHLGLSGLAYNKCKAQRKPLIFVSHNTHRYFFCNHPGVFTVHNAEWSRDALMYRRDGIVVNPPVDYRNWVRQTKGEYITLVNYNENKGGATLREVARMMPDRKFLAVAGGYGKMVSDQPDNVEIMPNTPDMQAVYEQSRIVLMPSDYESWGRVAGEAMACGIPVIASPTPGLRENLKSAGTYVARTDYNAWVRAIRKFDDENYYIEMVQKGFDRIKELDPEPQMLALNQFLHDIHSRKIT